MNKILIADDDADVVAALRVLLREANYQTLIASSVSAVKAQKDNVDLVLLDMNYQLDTTSGDEGLALIDWIRQHHPTLPVVAMTGWSSVELSVNAMKAGAGDFIEKPWDNERLLSIISNQIKLAESRQREQRLGSENRILRHSVFDQDSAYIAEDPASKQLLETASQIAQSDINIILYGENGTGKSLLAKTIHQLSQRQNGPFIAVNMGSIPESLFESEMFGHVKGAFTDANSDRVGRFELAEGGTLFLDEIANVPLSQQAKLLRVLESLEFERVGSSKTLRADTRIICATNAYLPELCERGEFRKDLMYRLAAMELTVQALRDRSQDLVPLVKQQIDKICRKYKKPSLHLSTEAELALFSYDWPGNIRELQHCIERAIILAQGDNIVADDLRLVLSSLTTEEQENSLTQADISLDEFEKKLITSRLKKYHGRASQTADSLGLSRSAFYRRLEKFGIATKGE